MHANAATLITGVQQQIRTAVELLQEIERNYAPASFANSFGAEDMVLTDLISKYAPGIEIFSLDTGRLPEETYRLMHEVQYRYGIRITTYFPDTRQVEEYLRTHGPNAFYQGVELRKQCCSIRKVEPLKRALTDKKAWITGLRRTQAPTRNDLGPAEWDPDFGLHKFNPLIDWSETDVWDYIRSFGVPYNELHDQGYPSIGCAPCTRAISAGEDIRAGRWWWESPATKECGLHAKKQRK